MKTGSNSPEGTIRRFWHSFSPKSALRLCMIIAGLSGAFPAVSDAAKAGGGTTTTMVLSYSYSPPKWVARIDPPDVQAFQLKVMFDPNRTHLDPTVGTNLDGLVKKNPFSNATLTPVGPGIVQITGSTSTTSPGDVDIFELVFIDDKPPPSPPSPRLPIQDAPFTVFACNGDFIDAVDLMQTYHFDSTQIAPTTRIVTPGVLPHIWDPDTQYNNGTTGGPGTWDANPMSATNSWDDLPLPTQSQTDTAWDNTTHANDIAVFGGNPGTGIVTVSGPISVGGFQFDNSGYNIQGDTLTLSAPAGVTSTIDTGANNATISSTISGSGFIKLGPGTLTLTGANTYTGGTIVNAGTLLVNNSSGSGTGSDAVTVNTSGSVLGGTGTISGPITVNSGAAVLGGTGTTASGALTVANNLTLNSGSIIEIALGAAGAHSTLSRTGGGTWTFASNQAFTFIDIGAQPGVYANIITGLAGDPGGEASWTITNAGFAGTFSFNAATGNIDVNITAVQHATLQLTAAVSRKLYGCAVPPPPAPPVTVIHDVNLPLTGTRGVECRSGGATNDYTMVFTFTNNVVSGNANVFSGTGSVAGSPTFSGNVMIVNLTGVTNAQYITVNLTNVTDPTGNTIGSVPVTMGVLLGDVNANGLVNSTDASIVQSQSGTQVTNSNFRTDVNANGLINSTDTSIVRSKSGTGLPTPPPSSKTKP